MARQLFPMGRDRRAVSSVAATGLMVGMTVGMGAAAAVMFFGIVGPLTPPDIHFVTLRDNGIYASGAPGYPRLNDTFLQVIETSGDPVLWAPALQYQIWDAQGQLLIQGDLEQMPQDPYLGVYHASPSDPSLPVVGYIDVDPAGRVTPYDTVQLMGLSEEYHESTFRIMTSTVALATYMLA